MKKENIKLDGTPTAGVNPKTVKHFDSIQEQPKTMLDNALRQIEKQHTVVLAYILDDAFGIEMKDAKKHGVTRVVENVAGTFRESYYINYGTHCEALLVLIEHIAPSAKRFMNWRMHMGITITAPKQYHDIIGQLTSDIPEWFTPGTAYVATHIPTGSEWLIYGVNLISKEVCIIPTLEAYPISDFKDFRERKFNHGKYEQLRRVKLGNGWL